MIYKKTSHIKHQYLTIILIKPINSHQYSCAYSATAYLHCFSSITTRHINSNYITKGVLTASRNHSMPLVSLN